METFFIILISFMILYFCILSIGGLSGLFSERVGIINIGIDGMMIIGALTYAITARLMVGPYAAAFGNSRPGWFQIPLFAISMVVSMAFSWLHGLATIKLKSDHTISGVAINSLAAGIALTMVFVVARQDKIDFAIDELAVSQDSIGSFLSSISLKIFIVPIIGIAAIWVLKYTKWGLRFKAIGENPQAADVAGVNVNRYKWQGISISGALAGLAGAFMAQYLGAQFIGNVQGLGFLAIAILIMGQWRGGLVFIAALGFSFIYGFSIALQSAQWEILKPIVPYKGLFTLIPYLMTLIVLIFTSRKSKAPKAAGINYDKSVR
ncbi:ABC transporter permease [Mycoplasmopsis alligatoris]|uniref:Amino acid or sugar ABC transport system, permease protein n=1 Tax=Mycoplasmopsis alligatoris A21JP2 TaxID=747682 RepID=D4XUW8_9BACT|nr:ABC transporter permease [Mycoplasmopsis alligatoris]EFF41846.1 amino acid or sugar ABC transport system, permease protein [Mycoplasmopsis alligatoris A21JP2]